jgi:hypothetical protein
MRVKPLKTNDSAKSLISTLNDLNDLRRRGETFGFVGETNPFVFPIFGLVNARNETGVACRDGGYGPEGCAARMRSLDEAEGAKEVAQKST